MTTGGDTTCCHLAQIITFFTKKIQFLLSSKFIIYEQGYKCAELV